MVVVHEGETNLATRPGWSEGANWHDDSRLRQRAPLVPTGREMSRIIAAFFPLIQNLAGLQSLFVVPLSPVLGTTSDSDNPRYDRD